jgi:hypothetical protein
MSRLLESGKEYREKLIAKNSYNRNNEYTNSHKNALSDGDEHGRGELNGTIGTSVDIKQRETLIAKNKYNSNNEYGESGTV